MMTETEVDQWVKENEADNAYALLDIHLPKHRAKLDRLDKRISEVLKEIQDVFPDAQYYTASGGFNLILGCTHEGLDASPQQQRSAWAGQATIGDGDW